MILLGVLGAMARRRSGDYLGRLVTAIDRATGRRLEASRVIRFILAVEDVLLQLLRGDRRRLVVLTALAVVCYVLMAIEVWLVFWAIGQPIGVTEGLAVETFARLASIASAAIPATSACWKHRTRPWSPPSAWRAAVRWRSRGESARYCGRRLASPCTLASRNGVNDSWGSRR